MLFSEDPLKSPMSIPPWWYFLASLAACGDVSCPDAPPQLSLVLHVIYLQSLVLFAAGEEYQRHQQMTRAQDEMSFMRELAITADSS